MKKIYNFVSVTFHSKCKVYVYLSLKGDVAISSLTYKLYVTETKISDALITHKEIVRELS